MLGTGAAVTKWHVPCPSGAYPQMRADSKQVTHQLTSGMVSRPVGANEVTGQKVTSAKVRGP